MKTCKRCCETKDSEAFQRDPRNADGLRNVCRECRQTQKAEWNAKQPADRIREYGRRWASRNGEAVAARVRSWRHAQPDSARAQTKRARAKHRDRWLARAAVYRAVKAGTLTRPDHCARCGKHVKIDAHHEDYSKPLIVTWVCRPCHRALDDERRRAEQEQDYAREEARQIRAKIRGEEESSG